MTIANAMVKSKRITNLPAAIPTNHHQKLPPKSAEPATATSAKTAILYLVFIAVVFLSFMRILEVRELSFIFYLPLVNPTFFLCVFPSGRSFSFQGLSKGAGFRTNKVYGKNTLKRSAAGRFFP